MISKVDFITLCRPEKGDRLTSLSPKRNERRESRSAISGLLFDSRKTLCYSHCVPSSEKTRIFLAFLTFHLRVGIRVALRILAPVLAAIFGLYYILKPEFFMFLAQTIFKESGNLTLGLFFALLLLPVAFIVSPRICYGLGGWLRHLPAGSALHRRLAALAIFMAMIPALAVLAALASISLWTSRQDAILWIFSLVSLGLASSASALPVKRRPITAPLGILACVLCASGSAIFIGLGIGLILVIDQLSGPMTPARKSSRFRRRSKGSGLLTILSWRAVRLKIIWPYLFSILVLLAIALFLRNNSLNPRLISSAVRFWGTLCLAVFLAILANILAVKRPPWPWVRSLPLSSLQRILSDSIFLAAHASILLIPIFVIHKQSIVPVAAFVPAAAARAAGIIRQARELRSGAAGTLLLEGSAAALCLSLWSWTALFFLACAPLALLDAVRKEQNQKVSLWLEIHHLAAGDSLSWSQG
jgi:hypothetical protein